jgi:hypothetical protein
MSLKVTFQQLLRGEIIDNQLNPAQLAVAKHGYRIQSQILGIPDRLGIFSPGPPRLQTHEGAAFVVMTIIFGLIILLNSMTFFFWKRLGDLEVQSAVPLALGLVGAEAAMVVILCIACCFDRRRSPGYVGGLEGKTGVTSQVEVATAFFCCVGGSDASRLEVFLQIVISGTWWYREVDRGRAPDVTHINEDWSSTMLQPYLALSYLTP